MLILGILSVLQMILLPGLVLLGLFKFQMNLVARIVLVFGVSLFANFLIVFCLSMLKLYSQISILVLIGMELIALIWIYRKKLLTPIESVFSTFEEKLKSINVITLRESVKTSTFRILEYVTFILLLVFAVTDLVWMGRRFTNNFGTVFNTWDAVVSWNQWAVTWSQSIIPHSSYYPQLIPSNWSLSYVLLKGVEIQFFPKVIMPLFGFLILLMLFDLGVETRSFGFFIGVIFTRLLMKKFTGSYIADGYVDLPVTFFGFASVYLLLKCQLASAKKKFEIKWVLAGCILAVAAALTKQAGIAILILYPLFAFVLVLRLKNFELTKEQKRKILIFFGCSVLVVLAWYLYKWLNIQLGIESSNISYVTKDIYGGAGLFERAINAIGLLGNYAIFFAAILPAIILIKPSYRWLGILLVVPYSILWLFFFSYEVRNLALVFPFWGLILGLAIQQCVDYAIRMCTFLKLQKIPVIVIPILVAIAMVGSSFFYTSQKILASHEEQLWQIFNSDLDSKIRVLVGEVGTDISVLTDYPIDYLPGLEGTKVSYAYDSLSDYHWALENTDVQYLLVPDVIDPEVEKEIQAKLDDGSFEFLFSSGGGYAYRMIKIAH